MLAVTRFVVPPEQGRNFLDRAEAALAVLRAQAGYVRGSVGRATDDPTRWVIVTAWAGVGAYRRALSAFDVRLTAVPLLTEALDEPGAFEVVAGDEDAAREGGVRRAADAERTGPGRAAAPIVPVDLDR